MGGASGSAVHPDVPRPSREKPRKTARRGRLQNGPRTQLLQNRNVRHLPLGQRSDQGRTGRGVQRLQAEQAMGAATTGAHWERPSLTRTLRQPNRPGERRHAHCSGIHPPPVFAGQADQRRPDHRQYGQRKRNGAGSGPCALSLRAAAALNRVGGQAACQVTIQGRGSWSQRDPGP